MLKKGLWREVRDLSSVNYEILNETIHKRENENELGKDLANLKIIRKFTQK